MKTRHLVRSAIRLCATVLLLTFAFAARAQDMPLSMLLIEGQDWKLAVDGLNFSDGPTADAQGNLYFCEMRSEPPVVWKITPEGTKSKFVEGTSCSGLKWGPDGRLYACASKDKQVVEFEFPGGKKTVLAEDVQPNDLVVSAKGLIYITETGKKQVTLINPKTGEKKAVYAAPLPPAPADGKKKAAAPYDPKIINAPNGITLSPDQGTLAVSDVRGQFTWAFRVEADGTLASGAPYMTMRTPVDPDAKSADGRSPVYKTTSGGDGMTSDAQGRYYVSSHLGVQVFDPTGRMCGVLPNPGDKNMTSVGFAGEKMDVMYVTCGDKIYSRKVQANGNRFFLPPAKPAAASGKKK